MNTKPFFRKPEHVARILVLPWLGGCAIGIGSLRPREQIVHDSVAVPCAPSQAGCSSEGGKWQKHESAGSHTYGYSGSFHFLAAYETGVSWVNVPNEGNRATKPLAGLLELRWSRIGIGGGYAIDGRSRDTGSDSKSTYNFKSPFVDLLYYHPLGRGANLHAGVRYLPGSVESGPPGEALTTKEDTKGASFRAGFDLSAELFEFASLSHGYVDGLLRVEGRYTLASETPTGAAFRSKGVFGFAGLLF